MVLLVINTENKEERKDLGGHNWFHPGPFQFEMPMWHTHEDILNRVAFSQVYGRSWGARYN